MASKGVNKVLLVGNCGQDPETRYSSSGAAITNLSIATSDTWKDKQTGQPQERTEWHRVVFFNRLAEIAGDYLRKGSKVYVEGRLQTRKWQDQSGQDRYTTEIVANEMQMLDSRNADNSQARSPQQGRQPNNGQAQPSQPQHDQRRYDGEMSPEYPKNQRPSTPPNQTIPRPGIDPFDDFIPF